MEPHRPGVGVWRPVPRATNRPLDADLPYTLRSLPADGSVRQVTVPQAPCSFSFPPGARLHHGREYTRVFKSSVRSADGMFSVLARPNGLDHARLGMAVSRKAARSAVARNRVKRIIREVFRHASADMPPVDLVVIARPNISVHSAQALRDSLQRHWRRIIATCAR